MPPLVDECLPLRHLARFVVEVIAGLDVRAVTGSYRGTGEAPSHPKLLPGILVYGYATGVSSASLGFARTYRDDLAQLDATMGLCDAFCRWARDAVGETHNWPAPADRSTR